MNTAFLVLQPCPSPRFVPSCVTKMSQVTIIASAQSGEAIGSGSASLHFQQLTRSVRFWNAPDKE